MFPVKEHYLEDILLELPYTNEKMQKLIQEGGVLSRAQSLETLTSGFQKSDAEDALEKGASANIDGFPIEKEDPDVIVESVIVMPEELKLKIEKAIAEAAIRGCKNSQKFVMDAIMNGDCPIDYQV